MAMANQIEGGENRIEGEGEQYIVFMDLMPYESAGFDVSSDMVVMKVDKKSQVHGQVALGDKITSINYGFEPTLYEWRAALVKKGEIDLVMHRPPAVVLPNVFYRDGYHYQHLVIQWEKKNPKIDLVLKENDHKIYVYHVGKGSLFQDQMIRGDRLVLIEDSIITSKEQCFKLLGELMKKKDGDVFEGLGLVVERGGSEDAIAAAEEDMKQAIENDVDCLTRITKALSIHKHRKAAKDIGIKEDCNEYKLPYFHTHLNKSDVETLLRDMPEGSYYLQEKLPPSSKDKIFFLVVKFNNKFHHLKVKKDKKNGLHFMDRTFQDIDSTIDDMCMHEFVFEGMMLKLNQPIIKSDIRRVRGGMRDEYNAKKNQVA